MRNTSDKPNFEKLIFPFTSPKSKAYRYYHVGSIMLRKKDKRILVKWLTHLLVGFLIVSQPYLFSWLGEASVPKRLFSYLSTILITTLPFYVLNVLVIVPFFLKKRKYWQYSAIIVGIFLAFLLLSEAVAEQMIEDSGAVFTVTFSDNTQQEQRHPPIKPFIYLQLIVALAVSTGIEVLWEWHRQHGLKNKAEKEKIVSELLYLKAQVNPHFLFNALNGIYYLASQQSVATGEAVLLLSNLMRYTLYQASFEKIELTKEIRYLEDYIALQKLRLSATKDISIRFETTGSHKNILIEPLLFIPFVENAFKHGVSYRSASFVNILIDSAENRLLFRLTNSSHARAGEKEGGIGLQNVKRRLALVYPDSHSITVNEMAEVYEVKLEIRL